MGFKFVDLVYKSSDVSYIEIKIISQESTLFYLSYEILSIVLLNMVSAKRLFKDNVPPSLGARRGDSVVMLCKVS